MFNTIQQADNVQFMEFMPDEIVDLTVTSPPYDDLRDYEGDIMWDFDKFKQVANELYRITKHGGVVVWVVNDSTKKGDESGNSFRQALYFKSIGFNLHDTMIWVKDGGGAVGSAKCYTQNFEYMFVFSKGKIKTYNLIKDKENLSHGVDKSGVGRRRKNGEHKIEKRKESKPFSKRNNWWYIPPQKGGEHPAVFPEELARDHIVSWSNEGDTVFDPFAGSGTTCVEAFKSGRKFIGLDISEKYVAMANIRIKEESGEFKQTMMNL